MRKNFLSLLTVVLVMGVSGCATKGSQRVEACKLISEARTAERWKCLTAAMKKDEEEKKIAELTTQCKKYGFAEGSDAIRSCMMQIEQTEKMIRRLENASEPTLVPPKVLNCVSTGVGTSQCR